MRKLRQQGVEGAGTPALRAHGQVPGHAQERDLEWLGSRRCQQEGERWAPRRAGAQRGAARGRGQTAGRASLSRWGRRRLAAAAPVRA
eukprot:4032832-Pyramimonas_sp.AAC.1